MQLLPLIRLIRLLLLLVADESGATKGFWVPEAEREQPVNFEAVVLRFGSLDAGERTNECGEDSCDIFGEVCGGERSVEADEQEDEDDEQESSQSLHKLECVCGLSPSLLALG